MDALKHTVSGDRDRPATVFLHGFLGSSEDWRDTTAALDDEFRCVAMDLPGHGSSVGLPDETYTFEGAARAVIHTLDELRVDRATFVGYSMGGRLALYLALRYPQRCAGLLLESASPGLEDDKARAARRTADEKLARRLETEDFGAFLEGWYRQPLFASLVRDGELLERTIGARRRGDPAELAKSLRGMGTGRQPSLWRELAGLRAPALAVAGESDAKFVGISERMATLAEDMRVVVVSGVGHSVRLESPEAYSVALKDFLRRI